MMLKVVLAGLLVLVVVAAVLALTGHKSVHAETYIDAPPERVWAMITDGDSYPDWNPILIAANGEFKPDGAVTYMMKMGDSKPSEVTPAIIKFTANEHLMQFGGTKGVLTFAHEWRLQPSNGGTLAVQHEEYTGIGVWFWDPSGVEVQYQQGLDNLKTLLEGSNADS